MRDQCLCRYDDCCATWEQNVGKRKLLAYLIATAQATQGAEVWRALFAEQLATLEAVT
jgi:hypothetical protein